MKAMIAAKKKALGELIKKMRKMEAGCGDHESKPGVDMAEVEEADGEMEEEKAPYALANQDAGEADMDLDDDLAERQEFMKHGGKRLADGKSSKAIIMQVASSKAKGKKKL